MLRRTMILLVLVLAPASVADAATRYGGGTIDLTSKEAYTGSVGVSMLATDDGNAKLRIDGSVRCPSGTYSLGINDYAPWNGQALQRNGSGKITLTKRNGKQGTLRYSWSIVGTVDPNGITGRVRLTGKRKYKGRRAQRCGSRGGDLAFRLRPYVRAQGPGATSSVNQRFYGLTAQSVAKGAGPVSGILGAAIATTNAQGLMAVRTTLDPRCPEGNPKDFSPTVSILRGMTIQPNGSFSGTSTSTRRLNSGTYGYTTKLIGVVRTDGVEGVANLTINVIPSDGSPSYVCTSEDRAFYTLLDA